MAQKKCLIQTSIIDKTKKWLRKSGIQFFKELHEKHGKVNAVLGVKVHNHYIPHPVHFREGMTVRNFLRTLPECSSWTAHDFDNNWTEIIEECIK